MTTHTTGNGTDAETPSVPDTSGGRGASGGVVVAGTLIPGLLRECSPASVACGPERGVVVAVGEDVAAVAYEDGGVSAVEDDVPLVAIDLLLDDATGRTHATWAVARALGANEDDALTATFVPVPEIDPYEHRDANGRWLDDDPGKPAEWLLSTDGGHVWVFPAGDDDGPLGHLNPSDPRLLPDGSRLVDALALRAVVLHVAEEVTRG